MLCNKTKNKTINYDIEICTGLKKIFGLMFNIKFKKVCIFYFNKQKRIGLHSFFVFFPIEAIYLNKKKEVLAFKTLVPFRFLKPEKCRYIIESKTGTIKKLRIEKGDMLDWN